MATPEPTSHNAGGPPAHERARGHALGRLARATLLRPGRPWRVPVGLARGLRLEVDPRAPLHVYLGTAEIEIARYVRELAQPGMCCLEVGSHNAYYALILARLTGGRIVALDFDEQALARIARNLALNPSVAGGVEVVRAYVAHERDPAVGAETLDHLVACGRVPRPDLLVIDVEGAEATVLSGARELLCDARPQLIVETHSAIAEADCLAQLHACGYRPQIVPQRRWLAERRRGHNRWLIARG
jgi:Methyltransferase FkbM domain